MNLKCCNPLVLAAATFILLASPGSAISGEKQGSGKPETSARQGHWPQWRGPNRDNRSTETGLLQQWPKEGPPLLWRVEGLGEGIGSVSVAGGRIVTTGQHDEREFLIALEEQTGQHLWTVPAGSTVPQSRLMRWLSQRTPTIDGDRLYALTNQGELLCLQARDGKELWRKNYETDFGGGRGNWGWCDYPLVDADKLICVPGGSKASIVALNKTTGKVIWQTAVPDAVGGYAATLAFDIKGIRQYLVTLRQGLFGIAAEDGKILWKYDAFVGTQNSITPLVRGDEVFCGSTRSRRGIALFKLVPNGQSIVVEEQYLNTRMRGTLNNFQDTLLRIGDYVFADVRSRGFGRIEWRSGEPTWSPQRGRGMQALLYADNRIYVRRSDGTVTLIEPTPTEPVERGTFAIPDHERSIGATHPVIAAGRLYLRDNDRLFCYDIRRDASADARAEPVTIKLPKPVPDRQTLSSDDSKPLDAPFVATPQEVVRQMLTLAKVTSKDVVVDLGSGDGRIVITAAKEYGARAIGYEIDKSLVADAREKAKAQKLDSLVAFENKDLFKADFSQATVVAVYLFPEILKKLRPQFAKLKPGTRIVSHQFPITEAAPDKRVSVKSETTGIDHLIFLYTTPLSKAK